MVDCEVCGKPNAKIDAIIEGVKMRVCRKCAELSSRVIYVEPERPEGRKRKREEPKEEVELEVVED